MLKMHSPKERKAMMEKVMPMKAMRPMKTLLSKPKSLKAVKKRGVKPSGKYR